MKPASHPEPAKIEELWCPDSYTSAGSARASLMPELPKHRATGLAPIGHDPQCEAIDESRPGRCDRRGGRRGAVLDRPWIPASVTTGRTADESAVRNIAPSADAPVLPHDRGIGRVAFAYRIDGAAYLVRQDGRQYRAQLGELDTLSPSGR
jgi:hypothetical protein